MMLITPEIEMPTEEIRVPGVVLDDCITPLQEINSQLPFRTSFWQLYGKNLFISFMASALSLCDVIMILTSKYSWL